MPEYLSPGVYVEEVPSGNKPIEGVSTSTAGVVGVTQRGPVDAPTLVTSFPAFTRLFGGYLDHRLFTNDRDLLPYAVEGFFSNGGQRLYVTRVVGDHASFAEVDLFGVPQTNPAATALAAPVGNAPTDTTLTLDSGEGIEDGDRLLLLDGIRSEYVTADSDPTDIGIRLHRPLPRAHDAASQVHSQTITVGDELSTYLGGDLSVGDDELVFDTNAIADDGLTALAGTDLLRVQSIARGATVTEYVTVDTVSENGTVSIVEDGLLFEHPARGRAVHRVTFADAAVAGTTVNAAAAQGDVVVTLDDPSAVAAVDVVRIGEGANAGLHHVRGIAATVPIADAPSSAHARDTAVIRQVPLLRVHARYEGQWGNALRVSVRPRSILETISTEAAAAGEPVTLETTFGLYEGSVLQLPDGTRQRISGVDTAAGEVSFEGGVATALDAQDGVASIEFALVIERIEDDEVVEDEIFENLSMDPSHPRYALSVVGAFDRDANEPEDTGASNLIRLSDLTREEDGETEVPGAGELRLSIPSDAVDRRLAGGDDDLAGIEDETYIGTPAVDPEDRTGLQSLENIDEISIVAIPGRTSQDVQNALINHCTRLRYRFSVLDSAPASRLDDVQRQRRLYDTTYGALYYPWLVIGDRFGRNGDVHYIPPSGHVLGVYARSDVERGVHKAPANAVLRGIRDLHVRLTKGEQDILNPRHINCLRDFRDLNRGLRVWGARTLSSDPEWKYVNVRRLFLFIEKSIERGTQFAVFEPNAEPLWATIRRSVTNFLIAVWRDGALEGITQEEAFFVKVDRTTMTQNDIDNGRLIILVGIAPVKPAEFVIFRISQKTREATG